jgi:hypothetical protein
MHKRNGSILRAILVSGEAAPFVRFGSGCQIQGPPRIYVVSKGSAGPLDLAKGGSLLPLWLSFHTRPDLNLVGLVSQPK